MTSATNVSSVPPKAVTPPSSEVNTVAVMSASLTDARAVMAVTHRPKRGDTATPWDVETRSARAAA